ncbi:MAG: hypothetical protein PHG66_01700 [Candidatus Colwellbacteria bacterium]|nr:hypothetical protein [Candidatus Colwellbacteria bacterium]
MPFQIGSPEHYKFHGVAFISDDVDDVKEISLYDFQTSTYRKCRIVDQMPYDLVEIQFDDDKTCTVTCRDSYRLAKDEREFRSTEEMMREDAWRMKVVEDEGEFDFYDEDEDDEWIKAEVGGLVDDLVSGVIDVRYRKSSGYWGYLHYESRRIAEYQTKTPVLTEEDLLEEETEQRRQEDMEQKDDAILDEMCKIQ